MLGTFLIMAAIAKQKGWDLDKLTLEAQDANPPYQAGLWIDPDNGVDFITALTVTSGSNKQLYTGKLGTPWDFSTKQWHYGITVSNQPRSIGGSRNIFVRPDRSRVMYIADGTYLSQAATNSALSSFTYYNEYNHNTTIPSGWSLGGFFYSPDGYQLYLAGWNGGTKQLAMYQLSLSVPYNINGSVVASSIHSLSTYSSGQAGGMYITPNGKYLFFYTGNNAEHHFWRFDMDTAWDISTLSQNYTQNKNVIVPLSTAYGIWGKTDGSKLFTVAEGQSNDNILTWNLT